jgi:serine/threonine protein phosphatase PrpC
MLSIDVGSASHTGLIRERNEDSAITAGGVFAVADGMGGHAAGDMASRLAVASLMRLSANPDLQSQDIIAAVAQANADILDAVAQSSDRFGMGTTLTGVSLLDPAGEPRWVVFNVGDSRVYRFAGNQLTQLTVDHSEVGELLAAGASPRMRPSCTPAATWSPDPWGRSRPRRLTSGCSSRLSASVSSSAPTA